MADDAPVDAFAEAAEAYCRWCEEAVVHEAGAATRHLATLYRRALDLRERDCPDGEPESRSIPHDEWLALFRRLRVPLQYYQQPASPFDLDASPPTCHLGDVADDLADIWRDLRVGLELYRGGHRDAAESEWAEAFRIHWGRHAADALAVLHLWRDGDPTG